MSRSKKNKAVALKYNAEQDVAPVVIASGYGSIAEKIIDIAEQKGIPVFRDDSAASLMCMLEVGSSIPQELYEVIAAVYCQLLKTSSEIKHSEAGSSAQVEASQNQRLNRLSARSSQVTKTPPAPNPAEATASTAAATAKEAEAFSRDNLEAFLLPPEEEADL